MHQLIVMFVPAALCGLAIGAYAFYNRSELDDMSLWGGLALLLCAIWTIFVLWFMEPVHMTLSGFAIAIILSWLANTVVGGISVLVGLILCATFFGRVHGS